MARPVSICRDIALGWEAAAQVTASAFSLAPDQVAAASRGRGPRPPECVWLARKLAVHIAVVVTECDYAALGRHIGLHRDTVASHCASVRQLLGDDPELEALSEGLELGARRRIASARLTGRELLLGDPLEKLLTDLRHYVETLHPTLIRQNGPSSDRMADHGNVIPLPKVAP